MNESAGTLQTVNGTYCVFTVTSYSVGNGTFVTINGDGSGDRVVFNFGNSLGNVNLGGMSRSAGWSTTKSCGTSRAVTTSTSTTKIRVPRPAAFMGDILAPDDVLSMNSANLVGRFWGGDSGEMQIVSHSNLFGSPAPSIGRGLPVLLVVGGMLFGAKLLEGRSKKRRSLGTAIPHAAI